MSEESAQPVHNERHIQVLTPFIERVLGDTSPGLWDTRGWDLAKVERDRWSPDCSNADLNETINRVIETERKAKTRNWIAYKQSGGKYKGLDENGQPIQTDIEAEELEEETTYKSSQNQDFVTGGVMSGEQIILHTAYGKVITTVDRILTFRLFQSDVIRYTKLIYPSRYKKLHEKNVSTWLSRVALASGDLSEDDSLPINLFRDLLPKYIQIAETEEQRQERALRQSSTPILHENQLVFTMTGLLEWLRKVNPDQRFRRGEVKSFLRELYGIRFSSSARRWNLRCFSIDLDPSDSEYVEPAPKPTPDTVAPENSGTGENNPEEIQHDSGSGENDPAREGHNDLSGAGVSPSEHDGHILQPDNRGGSEGPPESEALPF